MGDDKNKSTFAYKTPEQQNLLTMPSSPALDAGIDIINYGKRLKDLPRAKATISHGKQEVEIYEPTAKRDTWGAIFKSKNAITMLELTDIEKLAKGNSVAKKLAMLIFSKACEQCLNNGELINERMTFPLQELLDIGIYSNIRAARKGFENGAEILTNLKIKGEFLQKRLAGKYTKDNMLAVWFKGVGIQNGQCIIYLNDIINWRVITLFYTKIPRYYFKLSNRAAEMLYVIFTTANKRKKDIAEKGYFTISLRAIHTRLLLPNENEIRKPKQYIKDPIEQAITEIEDAHKEAYPRSTKLFTMELQPQGIDAAPIKEYLDNGYLKISLSGLFAESFIQGNEKRIAKIEKATKRKEKLIDRAKVKAMADKMKEEGGGNDAEN